MAAQGTSIREQKEYEQRQKKCRKYQDKISVRQTESAYGPGNQK